MKEWKEDRKQRIISRVIFAAVGAVLIGAIVLLVIANAKTREDEQLIKDTDTFIEELESKTEDMRKETTAEQKAAAKRTAQIFAGDMDGEIDDGNIADVGNFIDTFDVDSVGVPADDGDYEYDSTAEEAAEVYEDYREYTEEETEINHDGYSEDYAVGGDSDGDNGSGTYGDSDNDNADSGISGDYTDEPQEVSYTPEEFQQMGVIYWNGWRWTYYSELILPGYGLDIPGRWSDGYFVRDGSGNIVVASVDLPKGTYVDTPFGPGKVYDSGCPSGTLDLYVSW